MWEVGFSISYGFFFFFFQIQSTSITGLGYVSKLLVQPNCNAELSNHLYRPRKTEAYIHLQRLKAGQILYALCSSNFQLSPLLSTDGKKFKVIEKESLEGTL